MKSDVERVKILKELQKNQLQKVQKVMAAELTEYADDLKGVLQHTYQALTNGKTEQALKNYVEEIRKRLPE
ncbi:MAG TPA: hypothetical protein VFM80_12725, partial [Gracilimonas sp.]|uniref:hypothetical protein n=1 Tax=Gracilimonas sp. TaxID=1974203 RepID=UPI002DA5E013|nr:hypothetical protein [Gracilimonas sp.]